MPGKYHISRKATTVGVDELEHSKEDGRLDV